MANGGGREMTPAQRTEAHNRHERFADVVMEMFTRGESFSTISTATGIPRSTVHHMVKRLGAEYVNERYGDHTAVLGRELAILDSLTRKNLRRAQDGDGDAARIVLESSRQRRRLLGLDAAIKSELVVKTATDIEIERLVGMLSDQPETEVPVE